jgi:hypothetical protein
VSKTEPRCSRRSEVSRTLSRALHSSLIGTAQTVGLLLGFVQTRTCHNFLLDINFSNFSTRWSGALFMQRVLQLLLKKFLVLWTTKVHYSDHKRPHFLSFSHSFIHSFIFFFACLLTITACSKLADTNGAQYTRTVVSTTQQKSGSLMAAGRQLMKHS